MVPVDEPEPTALSGLTPEVELARAEAGVHAGAAETNGHMHDDGVLLRRGCVGRAVLDDHCTGSEGVKGKTSREAPQLRSWHEVAGPNRLSDAKSLRNPARTFA